MRIKGNLSVIYIMFVLLAFFEPSVLRFLSWGDIASRLLWAMRISLSIFYILRVTFKYKVEKLDVLVFVFLISQLISSQQTDTFYLGYLSGQITALGLYAFLKYKVLTQPRALIAGMLGLFAIFLLCQVFTQLYFPFGIDVLHPYGDNREYFLGRKNAITPYLIFVMGCFYLLIGDMGRKLRYSEILMLVFGGVISLLSNSSTTIICFVLFILFRFLGIKNQISNAYLKTILMVYGIFSFLIFSAQSSFLGTITGLFGKDATFSGRLNIWQQAISFFTTNPLFGNGLDLIFNPWTNGITVKTAHNYLLDLLARFGIVTGVIFVVILISFIFGKNRIKSKVLFTILICYLYYILMESSSTTFYLSIVACIFYIGMQEGILGNEKTI